MIMLVLFLCVVMISLARSASSTENAAEIVNNTANDNPTTEDDYDVDGQENKHHLWLGMVLCICHAWLFSGVGVISRRLQEVHFSELMLHQAIQGILIIGCTIGVQALFFDNH